MPPIDPAGQVPTGGTPSGDGAGGPAPSDANTFQQGLDSTSPNAPQVFDEGSDIIRGPQANGGSPNNGGPSNPNPTVPGTTAADSTNPGGTPTTPGADGTGGGIQSQTPDGIRAPGDGSSSGATAPIDGGPPTGPSSPVGATGAPGSGDFGPNGGVALDGGPVNGGPFTGGQANGASGTTGVELQGGAAGQNFVDGATDVVRNVPLAGESVRADLPNQQQPGSGPAGPFGSGNQVQFLTGSWQTLLASSSNQQSVLQAIQFLSGAGGSSSNVLVLGRPGESSYQATSFASLLRSDPAAGKFYLTVDPQNNRVFVSKDFLGHLVVQNQIRGEAARPFLMLEGSNWQKLDGSNYQRLQSGAVMTRVQVTGERANVGFLSPPKSSTGSSSGGAGTAAGGSSSAPVQGAAGGQPISGGNAGPISRMATAVTAAASRVLSSTSPTQASSNQASSNPANSSAPASSTVASSTAAASANGAEGSSQAAGTAAAGSSGGGAGAAAADSTLSAALRAVVPRESAATVSGARDAATTQASITAGAERIVSPIDSSVRNAAQRVPVEPLSAAASSASRAADAGAGIPGLRPVDVPVAFQQMAARESAATAQTAPDPSRAAQNMTAAERAAAERAAERASTATHRPQAAPSGAESSRATQAQQRAEPLGAEVNSRQTAAQQAATQSASAGKGAGAATAQTAARQGQGGGAAAAGAQGTAGSGDAKAPADSVLFREARSQMGQNGGSSNANDAGAGRGREANAAGGRASGAHDARAELPAKAGSGQESIDFGHRSALGAASGSSRSSEVAARQHKIFEGGVVAAHEDGGNEFDPDRDSSKDARASRWDDAEAGTALPDSSDSESQERSKGYGERSDIGIAVDSDADPDTVRLVPLQGAPIEALRKSSISIDYLYTQALGMANDPNVRFQNSPRVRDLIGQIEHLHIDGTSPSDTVKELSAELLMLAQAEKGRLAAMEAERTFRRADSQLLMAKQVGSPQEVVTAYGEERAEALRRSQENVHGTLKLLEHYHRLTFDAAAAGDSGDRPFSRWLREALPGQNPTTVLEKTFGELQGRYLAYSS